MKQPLSTQDIPLSDLVESPINYRHTFDEKRLQELAESLRKNGQLQEINVRISKGGKYEIITGNRRYRASKLAGLKSLRCRVWQEVSEEEALDLQLSENLHQGKVSPIEEAHAFKLLHDKHKKSFADIAVKVDKSADYVRTRYKLTELTKDLQEFVHNDVIPIAAAIRVAALNQDQQKQLLKHGNIINVIETPQGKRYHFAGMSNLGRFLEREIFLSLDQVPWDVANKDVYKEAGACTTCEKRSDVILGLFDDIATVKGVQCMDRACYEIKTYIATVRRFKELKEEHGVEPIFVARYYFSGKDELSTKFKKVGKVWDQYHGHVLKDKEAQHPAVQEHRKIGLFFGPIQNHHDELRNREWCWVCEDNIYWKIFGYNATHAKQLSALQNKNIEVKKLDEDLKTRVNNEYEKQLADEAVFQVDDFELNDLLLQVAYYMLNRAEGTWDILMLRLAYQFGVREYTDYQHEWDNGVGKWVPKKKELTEEDIKKRNVWMMARSKYEILQQLTPTQLRKVIARLMLEHGKYGNDEYNYLEDISLGIGVKPDFLESIKNDATEKAQKWYQNKLKKIEAEYDAAKAKEKAAKEKAKKPVKGKAKEATK